MGLKRRTTRNRLAYRHGYLASAQWWHRRAAFVRTWVRIHNTLVCACCLKPVTERSAHVHHLSYRGVTNDPKTRQWIAGETDEDMVLMCPTCHQEVHRLFDTNRSMRTKGRRGATLVAIALIRRNFARTIPRKNP